MKKITLLFVMLTFCFTATAQFTFPTDPAVYTVPDAATAVPVLVNDVANAAGVPAGTYTAFTVTADWSIAAGNAWSNEARLSVVTTAGATVPAAATSGAAGSSAATTMTFTGALAGPYDPSVDGLLDLSLTRTFNSPGDWTNITVTIAGCVAPTGAGISNITQTSADFAWTAGGTETAWDVELVDITAAGTATGTPTATGVTNPYTFMGLAGGNDYEAYVRAACTAGGSSTWVGPVAFQTVAACPVPTAAGITNITQTSADFGWTAGGTELLWDVELVDITAAGTATGTPTATGVTNPYTFMGLTPANDYEAYVRADCGTDVSPWVGPVAFTTLAPPQTNDLCSGAIAVTAGNDYMGDTSAPEVTVDLQGDCGSVDNDAPNLWYSYTGTGTPETVTLSTCNQASYDTSIAVFTGTCGALVCFANNDDGAGCAGFSSLAEFNSDGVSTYYIMVEGFNLASVGTFTLSVTAEAAATPPVNNTCATATVLADDAVNIMGDSTNATANVLNPSCDGFASILDVWYAVTATTSEFTVTTTLGTITEAKVAVYEDCTQTVELGCSGTDNIANTVNVQGLTPGNTYYVQVWGDTVEGTFMINAEQTTLSVENNVFEGFKYFPNPVEGTLSLRAQNNIENVAIYNMLGQEVVRTAPNTLSSDLDMSNLNVGAYFVKVTINGSTETVRIIKE